MLHEYAGSVLTPQVGIIAHQVNCFGVMGSGVAAQIRDKYPLAYKQYRRYCLSCKPEDRISMLGQAQFCPVSFDQNGFVRIVVANLFGQYNYGRDPHKVYTNYRALEKALKELAEFASVRHDVIALPYKMGCGSGNGDWPHVVLPMIKRTLADCEVYICRPLQ